MISKVALRCDYTKKTDWQPLKVWDAVACEALGYGHALFSQYYSVENAYSRSVLAIAASIVARAARVPSGRALSPSCSF